MNALEADHFRSYFTNHHPRERNAFLDLCERGRPSRRSRAKRFLGDEYRYGYSNNFS